MDDVIESVSVGISNPIEHCDGTLGDDEEDERLLSIRKGLDGSVNNGNKRHRRKSKGGKHHKKWKPYSKMTWNERKELEEKETKRANQRVEKSFAEGHPSAPYNTTQFLMADHMTEEQSELDQTDEQTFQRKQLREVSCGSWETSDEFYESPNDEEIFLAKDFSDTYDNIHAERLQNMSKEELVKEYLEMELKIEKLERKGRILLNPVEDVCSPTEDSTTFTSSHVPPQIRDNLNGNRTNGSETVEKCIEQMKQLTEENERLLAENRKLRAQREVLPFQNYSV